MDLAQAASTDNAAGNGSGVATTTTRSMPAGASGFSAAAARAAYSVLRGSPVPVHQLIPTFPITRETLAAYPGWAGPLPAAFDKPWPSREPRWSPEPREVHRP